MYATGQTSEYLYVNAEQGLQINSSPDNWGSGWAGRNTTTICKTDGGSDFGGYVQATGFYINNANTKLSEGGGDSVRITTPSGYADIGAQNTGYFHFQTDRDSFYFNKPTTVNDSISSYDADFILKRANETKLTLGSSTATFTTSVTASSFVKSGGTSSQFLKADGSIDSSNYGLGSVTSVGMTVPTGLNITGFSNNNIWNLSFKSSDRVFYPNHFKAI